jgi:hypothetical protein
MLGTDNAISKKYGRILFQRFQSMYATMPKNIRKEPMMEQVIATIFALLNKNEEFVEVLKKRHMALEFLIVPSLQRKVNEILTHDAMQISFLYNKALRELERVKRMYLLQLSNLRNEADGVYEELDEIKSSLDGMVASDSSIDVENAYKYVYRLMAEVKTIKVGVDNAENAICHLISKGGEDVA